MKCYLQTKHIVISADLKRDVVKKGEYWTCTYGNCNVYKSKQAAIDRAEDYIKSCINEHKEEMYRYTKMLMEGIKVEE